MKNEVAEDFSLDNNVAKWKNGAEDETKPVTGKLFRCLLKRQRRQHSQGAGNKQQQSKAAAFWRSGNAGVAAAYYREW